MSLYMRPNLATRISKLLIWPIVAIGVGGAVWAYSHVQTSAVAANRPVVVNAICVQIGLVRALYAGSTSPPNLSGEAMRPITDPAIRPVVASYRRVDDATFAVDLIADVAADYPDVAAQVQHISVPDFHSGNIALCTHLAKECPPKGVSLNVEDGDVYVAGTSGPRRATPNEREAFLACAQYKGQR